MRKEVDCVPSSQGSAWCYEDGSVSINTGKGQNPYAKVQIRKETSRWLGDLSRGWMTPCCRHSNEMSEIQSKATDICWLLTIYEAGRGWGLDKQSPRRQRSERCSFLESFMCCKWQTLNVNTFLGLAPQVPCFPHPSPGPECYFSFIIPWDKYYVYQPRFSWLGISNRNPGINCFKQKGSLLDHISRKVHGHLASVAAWSSIIVAVTQLHLSAFPGRGLLPSQSLCSWL